MVKKDGGTIDSKKKNLKNKKKVSAIKAAKKIVLKHEKKKKQNQQQKLSLKDLAKAVRKQLVNDDNDENNSKTDDSMDLKTVRSWIRKSDNFHVDDEKLVTLRKRKSMENDDDDDDKEEGSGKVVSSTKDDDDSSSSSSDYKKTKKEKKEKKKTTSLVGGGGDDSLKNVVAWRKEHKTTLISTSSSSSSNDDTKKVMEKLNENTMYFPYTTFQSCMKSRSNNETSTTFQLSNVLIRYCTETKGFTKPSPIQAQAWPILTANIDPQGTSVGNNNNKQKSSKKCGSSFVGIAETGSGKTLAFALPALSAMHEEESKLKSPNRSRKPRMLVLAPTRELASQSHDVLEEFGKLIHVKSLVVYGGVPKNIQANELRKSKIDCIVATPGRLKDFLYDHTVDLSHIQYLVLDEADRMLDMGFEEDVRTILSHCPKPQDGRHTCMFSATWPNCIQKIAMDYMSEPIIRLYVGFEQQQLPGSGNGDGGDNNDDTTMMDDSLSANKRVKQIVEVIDDRARYKRLHEILRKHHNKRNLILIFGLYKKECEHLERSLKRDGYNDSVTSIHGNKQQNQRTEALQSFKNGTCTLLVATDVAARGLDIPNVALVINYTFPLTIEDYVHRIGRTARGGKDGTSITFFQPTDKTHAGALQQVLKQAGQDVPDELMKFGSTIKKKEHKLYGNFGPKDGPMKKATKITFDNNSDDDE